MIIIFKIPQKIHFLKGSAQLHRVRFKFGKHFFVTFGKDVQAHKTYNFGRTQDILLIFFICIIHFLKIHFHTFQKGLNEFMVNIIIVHHLLKSI